METKWFLERKGWIDDAKPLIFGVGAVLAPPLAGYIVARAVPNASSSAAAEDVSGAGRKNSLAATIGCGRGLKDELPILQNPRCTKEQAMANIVHSTSSTLAKSSWNEEEVLTSPQSHNLENKDSEKDREIAYLTDLVQALGKEEEILERQMLECCGLKEQEVAIRELEDQLKVSSAEAKCQHLKIKSLQEEKQSLKLQASEHLGTIQELESTKNEARQLRRRLASIRVRAKEKITLLEQKISLMLDDHKNEEHDAEVTSKLKRLKEVEDEAAALRMENLLLAEENMDLKHRIESLELSTSFALESTQTEFLEEINHLRKENRELKNKIKQLNSDHCADVEELIYHRWLNACLSYEPRNLHLLPSGQTTASEIFSPNSEKKAKKLILDHANEGIHDKTPSLGDLDIDCYSSSSKEFSDHYDDTSPATKNDNSKKDKFFGKFKKMVMRKKNDKVTSVDKSQSSCGTSGRSAIHVRNCSIDSLS